jgi:hypothetical protein
VVVCIILGYHTRFAGNEGNEGKDNFTVTQTTTVNSISCSSNAEATAIASAKSAHVNAFAEAHKKACSETKDPKWNGSLVSVWEKGAAYAVAKVSTLDTVLLSCFYHAAYYKSYLQRHPACLSVDGDIFINHSLQSRL